MEIFERIFVAVFARYRRKYGEGSLNRAWSAATYHVTTFVYIATMVFPAPLVLAASPDPAKLLHSPGPLYAFVIGAGVAVGYLVDRKCEGFRNNPPPIETTEPMEDARVIRAFHWTAVALFLVACALAAAVGRYLGLWRS